MGGSRIVSRLLVKTYTVVNVILGNVTKLCKQGCVEGSKMFSFEIDKMMNVIKKSSN